MWRCAQAECQKIIKAEYRDKVQCWRRRLACQKRQSLQQRTMSSYDEDSYQTNGGTVEGVWIFARHGDRAPSRPLSPPHLVDDEASFWLQKLPRPDSLAAFMALSKRFPPDIHPSNNPQFLDTKRFPFGFLTHTGIEQTRENGVRFFNRYNRHGYHLPGQEQYLNSKDFMDVWDLQVHSTNYLRTVMSAQSFLDGLLATSCYSSLLVGDGDVGEGPEQETDFADAGMHASIPEHASVSDIAAHEALVPVRVRPRSKDTLNAFDRNPALMADLVSNVISSPLFQQRDGAAATLAARLANILPGLARKKNNTKGFNAAPSRINWIEASDHFVCRTAHDVKYSNFTDFEHDDRVEQTLQAVSHQTIAHLAWRFRQWYKNPQLLAAIAGPPLREISRSIEQVPKLEGSDRHPFSVYSCHDVTILALLYGIGADFLSGEDRLGWRFWPPYACTLVFELVRTERGQSDSSHVLRVLLNGKSVKSLDLHDNFWDGPGKPVGKGPNEMLFVSDFLGIVDRLEQAGSLDSGQLENADGKGKRDMSQWTG